MNPVLKMDLRAAAKLAVAGMNGEAALDLFERYLLEEQLLRCKGNKSLSAKRLGISRVTVDRRLNRFGMKEAA